MFFKKIVPVLVVFVVFCGIKQPMESGNNVPATGAIYVTTNITAATIFLDNLPTGLLTPDTLKDIPIGTHSVKIFKNGYKAQPESILVSVKPDQVALAQFMLSQIVNQTRIVIYSDPAGAEIFVDGISSARRTPDTLVVEAGERQIGLRKNGYQAFAFPVMQFSANVIVQLEMARLLVQPRILIEAFANTSCLPCTTTSHHLKDLVNWADPDQYALMEYFTSWPNPQDIFYLANPSDNMARIQAYKITTVPGIFVSGVGTDPLDLAKIQAAYQSQLAGANQNIGLSLTKQIIGDSLRVEVEIFELSRLMTGDPRLFIALVEDDIRLQQAPGSNGLKDFNHVFRKFLTPNSGLKLDPVQVSFKEHYTTALSTAGNQEHLTIVGFIQDFSSKKVIQTSRL